MGFFHSNECRCMNFFLDVQKLFLVDGEQELCWKPCVKSILFVCQNVR
jgi:hypothetical protein